ncbi:L-rhamnose mutarotase [Flavivirga rizhaonensis]|nr:L-rhamnose mutarotase [Flavivirga rizhaonensis]
MKKHIISLLLLLIALSSCKKQVNNQENKPQEIDDKSEVTYSDNQFRRFTYFFQSQNSQVLDVFKTDGWKKCKEALVHGAIYDFNLYQKETDFFIVIDTDPSYNSKKMYEALNQVQEFSTFKIKLEQTGVTFPKHDSGLERIYKLDQKLTYTSQEGQLKTKIGEKKRFVWTLLLQKDPEMMAEYKRIHGIGQAWPEITANMKSIGVKDMEIYLFNEQAILIMDTHSEFDLKEVGPKWQKLPRETEWQEYVAKYQRTTPGSSIREKWLDMVEL